MNLEDFSKDFLKECNLWWVIVESLGLETMQGKDQKKGIRFWSFQNQEAFVQAGCQQWKSFESKCLIRILLWKAVCQKSFVWQFHCHRSLDANGISLFRMFQNLYEQLPIWNHGQSTRCNLWCLPRTIFVVKASEAEEPTVSRNDFVAICSEIDPNAAP